MPTAVLLLNATACILQVGNKEPVPGLFILKPFMLGQGDNDACAFHKLQDADSLLFYLVTSMKGRHTTRAGHPQAVFRYN